MNDNLIISKSSTFGYLQLKKNSNTLYVNNFASKLLNIPIDSNKNSQKLPVKIKNLIDEVEKNIQKMEYPFFRSFIEEKFEIDDKFLSLNLDILVESEFVHVLFCDATDKHLLEIKLDQKRQLLSNISQNSAVITWIVGLDLIPTFISNSARDFFGIDNFKAIDWEKVIHHEDYPKVIKIINESIVSAKPYTLEFRCLRADGKYRWLKSTGSPIFDVYGVINGFVGTAVDIHDHIQSQITISETEEWFRTLVQNSTDIMTVVSREGIIQFISPSGRKVLSYGDEHLGANYFDRIHPDQREKVISTFLSENNSKTDSYVVEYLVKDGHDKWVYVESISTNLQSHKLIKGIVLNTRDITYRKKIEKQLEKDAYYDSLTGLPNRQHFFDKFNKRFSEYSSGQKSDFALMFLDIDRFKLINDSLGHLVGDKILINLAKSLLEVTYNLKNCYVARLGGDEFTILVEDCDNEETLVKIAKAINDHVSKEIEISGRRLVLTLSIGIASTLRSDYSDCNYILRDADTAMYRAKSLGLGKVAIFDDHMHEKMVKQLEMESEIRRALANSEFALQFQPIFTRENQKIVGLEAFVRWNHPQNGLLHPKEFLPVASDSDLIGQIDIWALKESVKLLKKWEESGVDNLFLSLNISKSRFNHNNFSDDILNEIKKANIKPSSIRLEFREDLLLENEDVFLQKLNKLSNFGIKLALDNFGRGYCSLSFLQKYPINALKIDKVFTANLADSKNQDVVSIIETLSQKFGLKIMLEAIETEEQYQNVQSIDYHLIQGNYLKGVLNGDEVVEYYLEQSKKSKSQPTKILI
jgi:diguanylate cyclase (GGDEF)-like protein/PAS domain S-box-containing protein